MSDARRRYRVAVVGPGRVGTVLAAALARSGDRIVAVGGGSAASRARFTQRHPGAAAHDTPAEAAATADLVLLTTPDDVLADVARDLAVADGVGPDHRVVHLAGSFGLAPLHRIALTGARVAACHPAQTVPSADASPDTLIGAAWAVTAAPADTAWAEDLVSRLGGDAYAVPDDARVRYHAGLAVASNAVAAAVSVARRLLLSAGISDPTPFLGPLIAASTTNVLRDGAQAITGPVVRGDAGTLERHLADLDADAPELAEAYRALSAVILAQVRPALGTEAVARIEHALSAGSR